MGKIFPLILGLVGLGAGIGAGYMLKPDAAPAEPAAEYGAEKGAEPAAGPKGGKDSAPTKDGYGAAGEGKGKGEFAYLQLDQQFIVPLVQGGKVRSLVLIKLSLEVASGRDEEVFARQPRLEDAILTVLFDHANAGGFDGAFTASGNMAALRGGLREVARKTVGEVVNDVLITGIVRQDV